MEITVDRITKLNGDTATKAMVTIRLGEWIIGGVRVVDTGKGPFVSMPQTKWKADGKFHDTVHPTTSETRKLLNQMVLEAYNK